MFDYGSNKAQNSYSCFNMTDAKEIPFPMVSKTTVLDVISTPIIEVFPVSTTIVKVSRVD